MRVIDHWKDGSPPTISFELFPAKTEKAAAGLDKTISNLSNLEPDFVSVTFGAGGSTREGSRQLIRNLKLDKGLEVVGFGTGRYDRSAG
jgi:methylenetetrahydrofolate reductase (NADPH)